MHTLFLFTSHEWLLIAANAVGIAIVATIIAGWLYYKNIIKPVNKQMKEFKEKQNERKLFSDDIRKFQS